MVYTGSWNRYESTINRDISIHFSSSSSSFKQYEKSIVRVTTRPLSCRCVGHHSFGNHLCALTLNAYLVCVDSAVVIIVGAVSVAFAKFCIHATYKQWIIVYMSALRACRDSSCPMRGSCHWCDGLTGAIVHVSVLARNFSFSLSLWLCLAHNMSMLCVRICFWYSWQCCHTFLFKFVRQHFSFFLSFFFIYFCSIWVSLQFVYGVLLPFACTHFQYMHREHWAWFMVLE